MIFLLFFIVATFSEFPTSSRPPGSERNPDRAAHHLAPSTGNPPHDLKMWHFSYQGKCVMRFVDGDFRFETSRDLADAQGAARGCNAYSGH